MPSPILIYEDPAISTASARTATTTSHYRPSFSTLSDTSSAIEHWIETIPLTWDIGCFQWSGYNEEGNDDDKENVSRHCYDDDKAKLHLTHPYTPRLRTGKGRHMSNEDQQHRRKRRNVQTPGLTTPPAQKGHGHVPMTRRPMSTAEHLHNELDELADPDATPRSITATVHGTQSDRPPPLFAVPAPNFAPPPERAVSSSSGTSRSTASAKSSRSRSPTKLGAFQLSSFPVVFMPFGAQGYPTPSSVQGLCDDIEDIVENGEGIIPQFLEKHLDLGKEKIRRRHFASEWPAEAWPEDEFWSRLKEVHRCAQYCQIMKLSESSWNTEVHSRILSLALSGKWSDEGLWYIDVTTAKINKSLLPRINDVAIESRMVDYCLVLDRPEWKRQVVEKLRATNLQGINHSSADYLRFTPIALSIETKRGGDGEDKANVQLGIWLCAHFTQLQKLVPPQTPLPVLLVLIIQGDNWRLMTAECTASHEVHILQYLDLGKTSSILGILKLLASLRRIAAYIHDVYMPWYEQYVLSSVVAHSTEL